MKKMFKTVLMSFVILLTLMSSTCEMKTPAPTADDKQTRKTEQALNNATSVIGMPAIVNYNELKMFKWVLELRDQADLVTYTYLHNEMDGSVGQFLGKSIGYGIPAATQFTNPYKVKNYRGDYGQYADDAVYVIPQADPNGLFMPTSTDATWVILIDPKGIPKPQYIEGKIDVFTFKIK